MATFKSFGSLTDPWFPLVTETIVGIPTATRVVLANVGGTTVTVLTGTFTIVDGAVVSGTITGLARVRATGAVPPTYDRITGTTVDWAAFMATTTSEEKFALALAGNDSVTGNLAANTLYGHGGNDIMNGSLGADTMHGGDGNDRYYVDQIGDSAVELAGGGVDTVFTKLASYTLEANVEYVLGRAVTGQALTGNDLANRITGGNGNDTLAGGLGRDTLNGGNGDDLILLGEGGERINGGAGSDTVDYTAATDRVQVELHLNRARLNSGIQLFDFFSNVENARGSTFKDNVFGNTLANVLDGGADDDSLFGREGNDTLIGGTGNDNLEGGAGSDLVQGGDDADTLVGDADAVADTLDGGIGADIYDASTQTVGMVIDFSLGTATSSAAGIDTLISIEGAIDGQGSDQLIGSAGNDEFIVENGGSDSVDTGAGNDNVTLGVGADVVITYGAGVQGLDRIDGFVAGAGGSHVLRILRGPALDTFAEVLAASQFRPGLTPEEDRIDINLGGGDSVSLFGVSIFQLTAGDFTFV